MMKKPVSITFFLFTSFLSFSQIPDSDIWLLDMKDSAGTVVFSNPLNITHRPGYDNQPAFSPDGKYILFSSQRDSNHSTDIFKYDIRLKQTTQFTKTSTSEYSPTFMPDGKNISVVMVEKDSTQRLWKFPLDGGAPSCILPNVKDIGYHCWVNKDTLALFILTKPAFTLQIADVRSQKTFVAEDSIGRCMKMKKGQLWFTKRSGENNVVCEYFVGGKYYGKGLIASEDYCLRGDYEIWSTWKNSIYANYMNSKFGYAEVVNLEKFGITKPTRITISPDGKKLAVVSNK